MCLKMLLKKGVDPASKRGVSDTYVRWKIKTLCIQKRVKNLKNEEQNPS